MRPILAAFGVGLLLLGFSLFPQSSSFKETGIRPAYAQSTIPGPNLYFYAAVTAAQQIVPQNLTRHALQICNSGGTNALWIMPQGNAINTGAAVTPAANAGVPVAPIASNTPSCFAPPTNAPAIGQAWNGFSTTTPVTVLEWP